MVTSICYSGLSTWPGLCSNDARGSNRANIVERRVRCRCLCNQSSHIDGKVLCEAHRRRTLGSGKRCDQAHTHSGYSTFVHVCEPRVARPRAETERRDRAERWPAGGARETETEKRRSAAAQASARPCQLYSLLPGWALGAARSLFFGCFRPHASQA